MHRVTLSRNVDVALEKEIHAVVDKWTLACWKRKRLMFEQNVLQRLTMCVIVLETRTDLDSHILRFVSPCIFRFVDRCFIYLYVTLSL